MPCLNLACYLHNQFRHGRLPDEGFRILFWEVFTPDGDGLTIFPDGFTTVHVVLCEIDPPRPNPAVTPTPVTRPWALGPTKVSAVPDTPSPAETLEFANGPLRSCIVCAFDTLTLTPPDKLAPIPVPGPPLPYSPTFPWLSIATPAVTAMEMFVYGMVALPENPIWVVHRPYGSIRFEGPL
jgi:hypothetical protein